MRNVGHPVRRRERAIQVFGMSQNSKGASVSGNPDQFIIREDEDEDEDD